MATESDDDSELQPGNTCDNDETVELFGFLQEDHAHIQELVEGFRRVLRRKSIAPQQICGLGKLLHGLQRLPLPTPGIDITVNISGSSYLSLQLSDSMFELSSGGAEYTPDVGSDSYTSFNFLVEAGGYREDVGYTEIEDWISYFIRSLCEEEQDFTVDDEEEGSILEWNEIGKEKYWDQLASEF